MKKFIFTLAMPLALMSATANSATVLNKDNANLDVFGRVKFTASNDSDDGSATGLSARLGVKGSIKNDDDLTAFFRAGWDMQSSRDKLNSNSNSTTNGSDIKSRYVYVGTGSDEYGTLTLGQNDAPFYTAVTGLTDIFDFDGLEAGANTYGYDFAPNLALYSKKMGKLSILASYQFKTKEGGNSDLGDTLDIFDAGLTTANLKTQYNAYNGALSYELSDGLNVHTSYAYQTFLNNADKSNYGAGIDYTQGDFYIAGVYTYIREDDGTNAADRSGYDVAASYDLDKYTFTTGYAYGRQDSDVSGNDEDFAKALKVGVAYHIFKDAKAMAQLTHNTNGSNTYYGALNYSF